MDTKKVLIVTWITAAILGLIAYFVVFYTSGNYIVKETNNSPSAPIMPLPVASSTASSTVANGSSSLPGIPGTGGSSNESFASIFSSPPVRWTEGHETMAITGASLRGNQLTLDLEVDMGPSMECVPLNLRLLVDESGTLAAPATPQFSFPETGTCQGAPDATYGAQEVVFSVNPPAFPVFVTTGGASNLFLQIATTTSGGITVTPPAQSG